MLYLHAYLVGEIRDAACRGFLQNPSEIDFEDGFSLNLNVAE